MLKSPQVICFSGDLGAGKTSFIKGFASELCDIDPDEVISPTFTYLNIYEGNATVFHFDLYRLEGVEQFLDKAFDEYLEGYVCIEWPERIESLLDFPHCKVEIKGNEQEREIFIQCP